MSLAPYFSLYLLTETISFVNRGRSITTVQRANTLCRCLPSKASSSSAFRYLIGLQALTPQARQRSPLANDFHRTMAGRVIALSHYLNNCPSACIDFDRRHPLLLPIS